MTEAIIDTAYDSETLARSIYNASARSIRDIRATRQSSFYVIGNAADFDEYCEEIVRAVPIDGVACLWPKISRSEFYEDTASVHFMRHFRQDLPADEFDILLAQAVVAVADEIVAMLSLVLGARHPRSVTITCCTISDAAQAEIERYVRRAFDLTPKFLPLEKLPSGVDGIEFENAIYDRLDTRPTRIAPIMPDWILGQIRGTKYDKTQEPVSRGPTI